MRIITLFLIFLLAPLLGMAVGMSQEMPQRYFKNQDAMLLSLSGFEEQVDIYDGNLNQLKSGIGFITANLAEQQRQYEEQQALLRQLAKKSQEQRNLSNEIYEKNILAKLGKPFEIFKSDKMELKIFELQTEEYRGYAAKLKLYDSKSIKVVMAEDTLGAKETTSEALKRTGALFGVNGGGFYETVRNGEVMTAPIGNTLIQGVLIDGFNPTHDDLFFSGWTRQGDLVGGLYDRKDQLLATDAWYGVSFVPILIRNGQPLPIPEKWQREKHPRTVIGQYANGDLIFIVIDGRRPGWSKGISLEGMQIKLLELGVVNAYNLDGGGSSTMVFNGEVLNRPSDGMARPVATNILVYP